MSWHYLHDLEGPQVSHEQEVIEKVLVFNEVLSHFLITPVKRSYVPVEGYLRVEPDDLVADTRSAVL